LHRVDGLPIALVSWARADGHLKKRPVFGLFARCGRTTPLTAARSLSLGHCRIGTGEKFASCLTAYRSGFELLAATAIKAR
jgi:hypothetical protein